MKIKIKAFIFGILVATFMTSLRVAIFCSELQKKHKMLVCFNAESKNYPFLTYKCNLVPRGAGY